MRVEAGLDPHECSVGLVGQLEAEVAVDLGLRFRFRSGEDLADGAERLDHGVDLFLGHPSLAGDLAAFGEGFGAAGLDFGGPGGDECGVGTGFEGFAVTGELGVAFGDHPGSGLGARGGGDVGLGGLHAFDGVCQALGGEGPSEPVVERGQKVRLVEVDVAGVVDGVGQGVFAGEAAAVVQALLALLALHAPVADAAVEQSTEHIGVAGGLAFAVLSAGSLAGEHLLDASEGFHVDQRLVDDIGGPHPYLVVVPAQFRLVAQGDVVDVDEDFVLALLVPDLVAGVAGVGQDGADRSLGPGDAAAVAVARPVMGRGAGDTGAGERFGDGVQAAACAVVEEDPLHDPGGVRVGLQAVQAASVGRFGGGGVRACVREPVAVGRATAQEAAFESRLGGHRGAHPDLDAGAFALAHPAEDGHHHVVGFGFGVDGTADLRHPQGHAVVGEDGEGQAELVPVEGTLRLADHHGVEAPVGVFERVQQRGGARPACPGDRPGLPGVEELRHDLALRFDQGLGSGDLPGAGGFRILEILGGAPPGEGERGHHAVPLLPDSCGPASWSPPKLCPSGMPVRCWWAVCSSRSRARAAAGVSTGG
nr:hypothetical protein [Streptomyces sp. SBT349]